MSSLPPSDNREHSAIRREMDEKDRRYVSEFAAIRAMFSDYRTATETAVAAAFEASKEAVAAALESQKEAVSKAEGAADKRFDSLGEDMKQRFAAVTALIETSFLRFGERLTSLETAQSKGTGIILAEEQTKTGSRDSLRNSIAIWAIASTVILSIVVIVVNIIIASHPSK